MNKKVQSKEQFDLIVKLRNALTQAFIHSDVRCGIAGLEAQNAINDANKHIEDVTNSINAAERMEEV